MTTLISRNIVVDGRRTSMRLEPEMWDALEDICQRERMTVNEFCSTVDSYRGRTGLTAATRVFLILYFRAAARDGAQLNEESGRMAFWQQFLLSSNLEVSSLPAPGLSDQGPV
ncbi:MAG: ribbon-helix-helix domain-containing protein [Alphaproteobacteria bacterium]|nr:ribbon-helix-helix domain-containing protein [Alphaproteobacteria bacterium]